MYMSLAGMLILVVIVSAWSLLVIFGYEPASSDSDFLGCQWLGPFWVSALALPLLFYLVAAVQTGSRMNDIEARILPLAVMSARSRLRTSCIGHLSYNDGFEGRVHNNAAS